jgi:hypothetical protein
VLPVDDHGERLSGGFERLVAGERRIGPGAGRTFAIWHVTALTDIGIQFFAAGFGEGEARAQPVFGGIMRHVLRQRCRRGKPQQRGDRRRGSRRSTGR